jgi:hypothetical protein
MSVKNPVRNVLEGIKLQQNIIGKIIKEIDPKIRLSNGISYYFNERRYYDMGFTVKTTSKIQGLILLWDVLDEAIKMAHYYDLYKGIKIIKENGE